MDLSPIPPALHSMLRARMAEVQACVARGESVVPVVAMGVLELSEEVFLPLSGESDLLRAKAVETARQLARTMSANYAV